jgi:chromosome segregation ATPase
MERDLTDTKEALEQLKKQHVEKMNEMERIKIQDTEKLRKDMLFKIKETKATLLSLNDE